MSSLNSGIELPPSAVELILSAADGHLVTINPDGSPQCSLVWSDVQDGEICVPSFKEWQKIKNMRREPRVLISYESQEKHPRSGMRYYLVVKGTARVTEGGAPELSRLLMSRFQDAEAALPASGGDPPGFVTRITPERITGNGPWVTAK